MEQLIQKILLKHNIKYSTIKKATSGFTNYVYFIDDDKVLKLSKDKQSSSLHKESVIYKNINLSNIPSYIASGKIDDTEYLIITKLQGKALYSIWHTLDNKTRCDIVKQIANILKNFNSNSGDFLTGHSHIDDWKEHWHQRLTQRKLEMQQLGLDTTSLNLFLDKHLDETFSDNRYGLVYNDAHFDNFLFDGSKVSLIDFDRVKHCPIDYELMIFKTMCDNPSKFASEVDDPFVDAKDYEMVYETFKQTYKELFEIKHIDARVKVYQFNYLMRQAYGIKNIDWAKQILKDFDTMLQNI